MPTIRTFIHGFKQFQQQYFCAEDSPFDELRKGQRPSTLVVACCDSRTDPSLVMQCEPGDIFVVRNIANIVPPYQHDQGYHGVSAALEYAVLALEVQSIIILGHSSCGGVRAVLDGKTPEPGGFVDTWISALAPARDEVLATLGADHADAPTALEMAGVLASMQNCMTFPWLAERVQAGTLDVHGWYFDMDRGQLFSYVPQTGSFEPLAPRCPEPSGDSPAGKPSAQE